MTIPCGTRWCPALLLAAIVSLPALAQQNLGHRVVGTIGLEAGRQPQPGLYASDRVLVYRANTLRGTRGAPIPVGLELDAVANGIGLALVLDFESFLYTAAIAVPFAHVSLSTTRPEASVDRLGLGDLFVQPIRLGWQRPRFDAVLAYAFYAPTTTLAPGGTGSLAAPQWTQEFSAGGQLVLDAARTWRVGVLASWHVHGRKNGIDLTRGQDVLVQGGVGTTIAGVLDLGLAAAALWQVTDDEGSALPPVLVGARDRVFALGPEVGLVVPSLRLRLHARFEGEVGARTRPEGWILVAGVSWAAWPFE